MWQSTNLANALGGITAAASAAADEVQVKVNGLNAQVDKLNTDLASTISAANTTKSFMGKLTESGFYMITLEPKQGSWANRLAAAENAPPTAGYCCGQATITIGEDLETVTASYERMVEAIQNPMANAMSMIDAFDFADYVPDPEPEILVDVDDTAGAGWEELFQSDVWKSATLGDVFGGQADSAKKYAKQVSKDGRSLSNAVNQAGRTAFAISKGLNKTQNLLTQMEGVGVYNIILSVDSGSYLSRLENEEGAPPTTQSLYTAGYVCISVGATPEALASKFDTLLDLVVG